MFTINRAYIEILDTVVNDGLMWQRFVLYFTSLLRSQNLFLWLQLNSPIDFIRLDHSRFAQNEFHQLYSP